MGGEVLPIIPPSCLKAGGGRVSAHLGRAKGLGQSSSRPWPQRPVSQWLAHRSLPFRKKKKPKDGNWKASFSVWYTRLQWVLKFKTEHGYKPVYWYALITSDFLAVRKLNRHPS
ncbi:hypothetical protein Hanom_Chr09g00835361 [Helianthus anomalus]